MELLLRIAIGAAGGALGGAGAGFLVAILALWSKVLRNAHLQARGRPAYKDCVLPLPFVMLNALVGLLLAGVFSIFITPGSAVAIGALIPATLLFLMSIGGSISQALAD